MKISNARRRLAPLAVVSAAALVLVACGSDGDNGDNTSSEDGSSGEAGSEEGDEGSEEGGGDLSGSINVSGSSTVEPITAIVAEEFSLENSGVQVAVDGPGTGDGFELFCNGETDISDASRPIKDEEITACEDNGIEYVELLVAYDGMAVMTSPSNDQSPECLNFADLYAMIGPEAEGTSTWADASTVAGELGSTTELPDIPLELTGPGPESGTYDSFIEIALEGIAEERGQEPNTRSDYSANADDNVIIQNIEASDGSLGWVGWAFAKAEGENVKNIPIAAEAGGECVEVSDETIADQTYPLSRPLFIYVDKAKAAENPALSAFVDFYLADLGAYVSEVGYVALPDDQAAETVSAWEAR